MSDTPQTPVSLLQRLQDRRDEAAWQNDWRDWYALYHPYLVRCLAPLGLPSADADDVVGEVLSAVVRELPQFQAQPQPGGFRRWLRTFVLHRVQHYWTRKQRRRLDPDGAALLEQLADHHSPLSRQWDREHDEYVLRRLLELIEPKLPAPMWRAFRGVVLENRSPQEVAAELGTSVAAVYIAKSRVLARLRDEAAGLTD